MKTKLSTYDISYIMKKFRLKTVQDFADFGLTLRYLGEGASRKAYQIRGYNLVVKIPDQGKSPKRHSLQEYKAYKLIKNEKTKKYKPLRKYLPIIHCCTKDGVILMDKYKPCNFKRKDEKAAKDVRRHADYLFPENEGTDMGGDNLGRDKNGKLVILDFGCFFRW